MNQNDDTPDRTPTPEQIAAWIDGESPRGEAAMIEAWMAVHPETRRDAEAMAQTTRLYRDQAIPMPSESRWQSAFDRIQPRVAPTGGAGWRLLLGLALASAAVLGAVMLARTLWPTTPPAIVLTPPIPPEEDEEPFAVARLAEVHIIHMDADDADRIVTGQPIMGTMVFAAQSDIDEVQVLPDPDEGHTPRLERRAGLPWVVLAKADEENEP